MARRKKGKGKSAKNASKGQSAEAQEEEFKKCPHSFVFHRGDVGRNIRRLVLDMRHVMEPFTASSLKVNSRNVLKDFISVAAPLNVTHLMTFSKSEVSVYLRVLRLPRGPTMTFKVHSYSLSRDVVSSLKRNQATQTQYLHHPLLVMNHFSGDGMHLKLMATMFQNLFPSINVNKLKLNDVKRCVLLNYNPDTKLIDFRHYNIRVVPVGMCKAVKKLVRGQVPNLANFNDISDFVLRDGNLSESEMELDGPHNEVTLPQDLPGRGNDKMAKSAIRLTEIGPRMTLQLIKIEEGVCSGEIMFHEYIEKTQEEILAIRELREKKRKLKEARKKSQEDNVKRKQEKKEELKKKSLEGMKKKAKLESVSGEVTSDQDQDDDDQDLESEKSVSDIDDEEYYRQEVGENPDPDMFTSKKPSTYRQRDDKRNRKGKVSVYGSKKSVPHKSSKNDQRKTGFSKQRTDMSGGRKRNFPDKETGRRFPKKKRKY